MYFDSVSLHFDEEVVCFETFFGEGVLSRNDVTCFEGDTSSYIYMGFFEYISTISLALCNPFPNSSDSCITWTITSNLLSCFSQTV